MEIIKVQQTTDSTTSVSSDTSNMGGSNAGTGTSGMDTMNEGSSATGTGTDSSNTGTSRFR